MAGQRRADNTRTDNIDLPDIGGNVYTTATTLIDGVHYPSTVIKSEDGVSLPLLEAESNDEGRVQTYDLTASQLLEEVLKELKQIRIHLNIITGEELLDGDDD